MEKEIQWFKGKQILYWIYHMQLASLCPSCAPCGDTEDTPLLKVLWGRGGLCGFSQGPGMDIGSGSVGLPGLQADDRSPE